MIVGHIGVRKGSKGLAGKNFKPIAGKPLIDWSLHQLLQSSIFDAVVVSTDDEEIYEHCTAQGTLPIGHRPKHLASDIAGKWEVWQHSLSVSESMLGKVDMFLDLDATSPLRFPTDITNAISLYKQEAPDLVMSCCVARKNPYFNLVEPDAAGFLRVSKSLPFGILTRQSAPIVYEHVASIYVIRPDYLRFAKSLYEGRVVPYLMDPERCLDIDTDLDFKLVEFLLNERLKGGLNG